MLRTLLAVLVLSLVPTPASVDLTGTWTVIMPAGSVGRPDGSNATSHEIRGTLDLAQKGETLQGTWRALDAWTMTGRIDADGRFALESEERDVPANKYGKSETVKGRWTMRGTFKDGAIAGTATLRLGDRDPIVHTMTASRK